MAILESAGLGQALTPAEMATFLFDRLTPQAVYGRAGFRIVQTANESIVIPRVTDDPSVAWVAEATEIPLSDGAGESITSRPKKLAGLVRVSNEVLSDSSPSAANLLGAQLTRQLALQVDQALFNGAGDAVTPLGLNGVTGLGAVTGDPTTSFDVYAEAIGQVEAAGGQATAILMHPDTWTALSNLKATGTGNYFMSPNPAVAGPRSIHSVPVYTSVACVEPGTPTTPVAFVVESDQIVTVQRMAASIEADSSSGFTSDTSLVRGIIRIDFAVAQPAGVVRIHA